jgi:hypothetical protein
MAKDAFCMIENAFEFSRFSIPLNVKFGANFHTLAPMAVSEGAF